MTTFISEFDPTTATFDRVHVLFQSACVHHKEKVAIEQGDLRVTYEALMNRVESIRVQMLAQQLGQGAIIVVCGARSVDAIACAIAVWSIGSTLMLIDSSIPEHRRRLMLELVPTCAVVHCGEDFVEDGRLAIDLRSAQAASAEVEFDPQSGDYAYIAFTSGSTGQPKAIVGSHNGLSHFLTWQSKEFSIGPGERFAHFTNLSFDVWFRDVFTPLISGATICIPVSQQPSAESVFDFLRSSRVTATHLVPSIANLWINTHWPAAPIESLRYAFFAGEPLEGVLVRKWKRLFPNCQIVNLYGPTETTLAKHVKRIDTEVADGIQPVGLNIPGSMTYILTEDGRICEHGQTGEICIATPYRSHGYMTEKGSVSPFAEGLVPESITSPLYRTGDLGRRNGSNEIEILGRKDDQIKINGVRVDLLEVKSIIASHSSVRDVFVCARQSQFTKSIVAFIESVDRSEAIILNFLRTRLPTVMVPSQLHFKDLLPRLPNGKIDRKSLTEYANRSVSTGYISHFQRQSAVDQIERIWIEILDHPNLLRSQNFFDVGGNSLSIVVLHERIEKQFKLKIPLVRFFQNTTVESQADLIDRQLFSGTETKSNAVNITSDQAQSRRRIIAARTRTKN